jgi:2-polyprenyl-3-methyl-5-hydroxy-6-metoxy-1,4-benzoquinol methylase
MLSFHHMLAEMLVKKPKQFDVIFSMKVIEHVDSTAMFLRLFVELIKACFLAAFLLIPSFVDMQFCLCIVFYSLSFFAAWQTPFLCLVGW